MIIPTTEQESIINYEGNLVAIARPGSGKTFVISSKIDKVLQHSQNYQGIIAISYTNKASAELKQRVKARSTNVSNCFLGTIDTFCYSEIIRPFLPHLWGKPNCEVDIKRVRDLPKIKNAPDFQTHNVYLYGTLVERIKDIRRLFQEGTLLLEMSAALALYILSESKACRQYIQSKFTHIFVDEYQDSSQSQHQLFLFLKDLGLTAIAVGDTDQSIFRFAGKDSEYLLSLPERKDFKTFPLNYNHRSHSSIINYSLKLLDFPHYF